VFLADQPATDQCSLGAGCAAKGSNRLLKLL
jgi:hypothetical protein